MLHDKAQHPRARAFLKVLLEYRKSRFYFVLYFFLDNFFLADSRGKIRGFNIIDALQSSLKTITSLHIYFDIMATIDTVERLLCDDGSSEEADIHLHFLQTMWPREIKSDYVFSKEAGIHLRILQRMWSEQINSDYGFSKEAGIHLRILQRM